jgi:hypothetical protein
MTKADPSLLENVVSPTVLGAMRTASSALERAGVRHVVVGGLAVGAHGFPRATRDVDFLVGDEAFERHDGGLVTLRPGVPFQVNGVAVDFLSPDPAEAFLADALAAPAGSFIDAPALIYLKLKSPRHKDRTDVIELIKGGVDVDPCRSYLDAHAPALRPAFESAVAQAIAEE